MTTPSALLFDLDGCLWHRRRPLPGACELLAGLRARGVALGFVTNASTAPAPVVAERLAAIGIAATAAEVMTPLERLAKHPALAGVARALVLAAPSVAATLDASRVAATDDPERAAAVVLGRKDDLDFADLVAAVRVLERGGPLLALNIDPFVPVGRGRREPGVGAVAAALTTATGVRPQVVGKPEAAFFEAALERFGLPREGTWMIGDSLGSDIDGAAGAGLKSVLIGEPSAEDLAGHAAPDRIVADLMELADVWGVSLVAP